MRKLPRGLVVVGVVAALSVGMAAFAGAASADYGPGATYQVEISRDGREISSNDNASYWQGYLGYPGIAVMLARGFYDPSENSVKAPAGIPWKEINRRFKNDYGKTIAEVMRRLKESGHDTDAVRAETEAILQALRQLKPLRGKRQRPPR